MTQHLTNPQPHAQTNAQPHAQQPVLRAGPALGAARLVAILLHGRGASAEDILTLADEFGRDDVAYIAPQAAGRTWYPYSFLMHMERNEPWLGSALGVIDGVLREVVQQGIPASRVALIGFSQGACLALEYAARNARRFAAVVGFSGGVIGPPGTPRSYGGGFDGTPVFLGCSDVDPHIPLDRVRETGALFRQMGAAVDERIYRGMGHTVVPDEIQAVDRILAGESGPAGDTGSRPAVD